MDQELKDRLDMQDMQLERIYKSSEKMRAYFKWTLIITVAVIILPLIGMVFVIPQFLSLYSGIGGL